MLPTLQKLRMLSRLLALNAPVGPFATTPDDARLRLERVRLRTVASFSSPAFPARRSSLALRRATAALPGRRAHSRLGRWKGLEPRGVRRWRTAIQGNGS